MFKGLFCLTDNITHKKEIKNDLLRINFMRRLFMYKLMVVLLLLCYPIIVPPDVYSEGNYLGEKECFACHRPKKELYLNSKHVKIFSSAPGTDLEAKGCEACH